MCPIHHNPRIHKITTVSMSKRQNTLMSQHKRYISSYAEWSKVQSQYRNCYDWTSLGQAAKTDRLDEFSSRELRSNYVNNLQ